MARGGKEGTTRGRRGGGRQRFERGRTGQSPFLCVGDSQSTQQHFVWSALVFGMVFEALTLEILHRVGLAGIRVLFTEFFGEWVAKDWQTAAVLPEILEAKGE